MKRKYLVFFFLLAAVASCKQQDPSTKMEVKGLSLDALKSNTESPSSNSPSNRKEIPFTLSPLQKGEDPSSILGSSYWLPLKGREKNTINFAQKNLNDPQNFPNTTCIITSKGALKCGTSSSLSYVGNGAPTGATALVEIFSAKVTKVAVSSNHICAIVDSALYCWGGHMNNPKGKVKYTNPAYLLGNNTSSLSTTPILIIPSGVTDISLSAFRTCAIVNASLQCWGDNRNALGKASIGEIGDGGNIPYVAEPKTIIASGVTSVSVKDSRACAVANNNLWCWGNGVATPTKITSLDGVSNWSAGRGRACLVKSGALLCNYEHNDPTNPFYKSIKYPNAVIQGGSRQVTTMKNGVSKQYTLFYEDYLPPAHDFMVVPGYEKGVKQVFVSEFSDIYVLHLNGDVSRFNNFSLEPVYYKGTNAIINSGKQAVFTSFSNIDNLVETRDQSPCVRSGLQLKCGINGLHTSQFDLPKETVSFGLTTYL